MSRSHLKTSVYVCPVENVRAHSKTNEEYREAEIHCYNLPHMSIKAISTRLHLFRTSIQGKRRTGVSQ